MIAFETRNYLGLTLDSFNMDFRIKLGQNSDFYGTRKTSSATFTPKTFPLIKVRGSLSPYCQIPRNHSLTPHDGDNETSRRLLLLFLFPSLFCEYTRLGS